jgi:hypothetical protein
VTQRAEADAQILICVVTHARRSVLIDRADAKRQAIADQQWHAETPSRAAA